MSLKIRCLDTDLSALDHLNNMLSVSTEMNDIELNWPNMYKDCVLAGTPLPVYQIFHHSMIQRRMYGKWGWVSMWLSDRSWSSLYPSLFLFVLSLSKSRAGLLGWERSVTLLVPIGQFIESAQHHLSPPETPWVFLLSWRPLLSTVFGVSCGDCWRRKWQPTPVFLPGESQGRRSLVGCRLWGRTESDTTEAT